MLPMLLVIVVMYLKILLILFQKYCLLITLNLKHLNAAAYIYIKYIYILYKIYIYIFFPHCHLLPDSCQKGHTLYWLCLKLARDLY